MVINIKSRDYFDIFIGRGSVWGNPFKMKNNSLEERDRVCDKYEEWFKTQYQLHKLLHTLKGKRLGCFCSPKRCHGDFLSKIANKGDYKP